jgi:hypothetical protein
MLPGDGLLYYFVPCADRRLREYKLMFNNRNEIKYYFTVYPNSGSQANTQMFDIFFISNSEICSILGQVLSCEISTFFFLPLFLSVTFRLPTDVQAEAIPLILGGGDVLMAAETGSGKTGAFCLPIIQIVWETLKDLEAGKGSKIIAQICKCLVKKS